ncbi:MAG: permease [Actinobacteria bacterium]|nr:permease [Actinomycetota bacterium]MCB8997685.1 permease [Actinomycetota bacterium]MCB9423917.1 permease [Actinomycetota bacterium]
MEILAVAALALVLLQPFLAGRLTNPAVQAGATVFVSIVIQALPFLVLGVVLSAAIAAFVPASFWRKALPKRPGLAVPVAGCAGAVLPGCECASVPVSGSLMSRGVAPAAALAFLLSAPAINPIVVISTFVAFPGQPMMAVARFGASLVTAVIVGWIWLRWGRGEWLRIPTSRHVEGQSRWQTFAAAATHDLLHAGGFLVVGGIAAAVLNVAIPQQWLQTLAEHPALAIVGLALLAVLLSICSEADAFVAASLTQFSLTARLAFLVVGPMVDLKLISLQAGTFGKSFMYRFAPTTFVMAVLMATVFGWWLL